MQALTPACCFVLRVSIKPGDARSGRTRAERNPGAQPAKRLPRPWQLCGGAGGAGKQQRSVPSGLALVPEAAVRNRMLGSDNASCGTVSEHKSLTQDTHLEYTIHVATWICQNPIQNKPHDTALFDAA